MKRSTWAEILAVALIFATALLVRLFRLDASLWNDEISTYSGAVLPLREVFLHRPHYLYYVLAHFALRIEDSEIMLRLPSVIGGCLGVLALYGFARQAGGRWVGLLSALLLTFAAYHVDRSQEARFYAIVMLASILMTWSLWRAVETNQALPWVAFVVSANLGVTVQMTVIPYLLVLLAVAGLWIVVANRSHGLRRIAIRLACLSVAGVLGLGGFTAGMIAQRNTPNFVINTEETTGADADDDGAEFYVTEYGAPRPTYRLAPAQYFGYIHDYVPGRGPVSRFVNIAALAIGAMGLFYRKPLPATLIAAQFVLVPIPFFIVTVKHWFMERYFCSVYPFYSLLIAYGIVLFAKGAAYSLARAPLLAAALRRSWVKTVVTASLGLTVSLLVLWAQVTGVRDYFFSGPPHDWRTAGRFLARQIEPDDTIAYARSAAKQTKGLPMEEQVFPKTSSTLKFYLRRELDRLHPAEGKRIFQSLRFTSASTVEAVRDLVENQGDGTTYIVLRDGGSSIPAARKELDSVAHRTLLRVPGLDVRILNDQDHP